jgi:hypothetical protein
MTRLKEVLVKSTSDDHLTWYHPSALDGEMVVIVPTLKVVHDLSPLRGESSIFKEVNLTLLPYPLCISPSLTCICSIVVQVYRFTGINLYHTTILPSLALSSPLLVFGVQLPRFLPSVMGFCSFLSSSRSSLTMRTKRFFKVSVTTCA